MQENLHRPAVKKFKGTKAIVTSIALSLVVFSLIGGTIAWLVAKTAPVVNTFTYGDINITLKETDTDGDGDPNKNKYPMIPGNTIEKDPEVTFKANSENAWLFVKLEKSANFDTFMEYEMADGWLALTGVEGVYYREMAKSDKDVAFAVIKDDKVNVKGSVTKEMLNALDADGKSDYPTLTVTAYAVQRDENIKTAADAWAKI
ncbi:MAG: hypothetical protein IJ370_07745 [Oscillospiraceae bacterium]|nr:hypothetical protein [Oscillospiraceae bacterium]